MTRTLLALTIACSAAASDVDPDRVWRNPKDGAIFVRIPAGELAAGRNAFGFPTASGLGRPRSRSASFASSPMRRDIRPGPKRRAAAGPGAVRAFLRRIISRSSGWRLKMPSHTSAGPASICLPRQNGSTRLVPEPPRSSIGATSRMTGMRGIARTRLPARTRWRAPCRTHGACTTWSATHGNTSRSLPQIGQLCADAHGQLGASWTRCPKYKMRDGRMIDGLEYSLGPVRAKCPEPSTISDDNPWDDDRGLRCIRRTAKP